MGKTMFSRNATVKQISDPGHSCYIVESYMGGIMRIGPYTYDNESVLSEPFCVKLLMYCFGSIIFCMCVEAKPDARKIDFNYVNI